MPEECLLGEDAVEFARQVIEMNKAVRDAHEEYLQARDSSLARKKRWDELASELSKFIETNGKPDPQQRLDFDGSAKTAAAKNPKATAEVPPKRGKKKEVEVEELEEEEEDEDSEPGEGDVVPFVQPEAEPVANAPVPVSPTVVDESPSIDQLDIEGKLIGKLVAAKVTTVQGFIDLIECKNPNYPHGPSDIPGVGRGSVAALAKVYEELKYGDEVTYDAPLPEAAAEPGTPTLVTASKSVKIRAKIDVGDFITIGKEYDATLGEGGEVSVEIPGGEPLMLTDSEFELVA